MSVHSTNAEANSSNRIKPILFIFHASLVCINCITESVFLSISCRTAIVAVFSVRLHFIIKLSVLWNIKKNAMTWKAFHHRVFNVSEIISVFTVDLWHLLVIPWTTSCPSQKSCRVWKMYFLRKDYCWTAVHKVKEQPQASLHAEYMLTFSSSHAVPHIYRYAHPFQQINHTISPTGSKKWQQLLCLFCKTCQSFRY